MLARLRKTQEEREGGFTLIELLVVVIIIGILAAIAIPTFLNQREKAWQKAAASDLRNAAVKMEEFFSDAGNYSAGTLPDGTAITVNTGNYAFKKSDDVTTLLLDATNAPAGGYCIEVDHAKIGAANSVDFHLSSAQGKPVAGACPAP